jgi:SAM-dependent methyltransferase
VSDPYDDGTCRWWHLGQPSAELLSARDDGWLGRAGTAVDFGCGLGTEIGFLAREGWAAVGIDLSAPALRAASAAHPGAAFLLASVLALPLPDGSADVLIDRGCFHYFGAADRARYVREAGRVLRRGGRYLLRACLTSAGQANGMSEAVVREAFGGWHLAGITAAEIASDTRRMNALVVRLVRS